MLSFCNAPSVTVVDSRGLAVRNIDYYRRPDKPEATDERITHYRYDARGAQVRSADPRLAAAGRANFNYLADLAGTTLQTRSFDAGTSITLSDAAGRPFMEVSQVAIDENGNDDPSQAVTRTWQYEDPTLAGRPLSVTEQVVNGVARVAERFVWAGATAEAQASNLVGQVVSHYDPAGLVKTNSFALTGVPTSVTRQLLKDADNPDIATDWQVEDAAGLEPDTYTTLTTVDATGTVLTTQDAAGHKQRLVYDVAGRLASSWLTLKGGLEQVIVKTLRYSAAGQKLREEHGNGVVTTYTYEPETQRLSSIKTERQGRGVRVLQDLRYAYDPVGNVLSVRNDAEATRFWRNQKVLPENTYTYDSLYQLVSATGREMADPGTYTRYIRTYTYDAAGNLSQIRHSAPATNNNSTTDITVSVRSNRAVLSTLANDPSEVDALFRPGGQQTLLSPGQPLAWTSRGELRQVTPVKRDSGVDDHESYRYDSVSRRVFKASTQQTAYSTQSHKVLYLPGLELRRSASGDILTQDLQVIALGKAGRAQVRVLHWESGKPAGIANDQLRYSYDNLLGSSALEVDGAGNLISQEEYYPYGGSAVWTYRNTVEAGYKTIRYSGKERDATGLYYYGHRYYQSWSGRWLSADPAGTVDGLNLYSMVRNNPVTCLDDQGLMQRNANDDGFILLKGRKQKNKQPTQNEGGKTGATAGGSREGPTYALKDSVSSSLKVWVQSRSASATDEHTEAYGRKLEEKDGSKPELKPVFLLTGWIGKGGDKSKGEGWRHMRENHKSDFKEVGVTSDRDMKELVMKAVTQGEVVGSQGNANGRDSARPIYKVGFKTRTHYIAVSTSPDGSIIGANPNDEKYLEAGLRDDVFPSTRHFYEVVEKDRNGPQRMANMIRRAQQNRTPR